MSMSRNNKKNANICQCFLNRNAVSPEQLWILIIPLSIYSYFESCWSVDEGFLSALETIVSFRVSFIKHTPDTSIYNDDDSSRTFLNSFCNARGVRLTKSNAIRMTNKWNCNLSQSSRSRRRQFDDLPPCLVYINWPDEDWTKWSTFFGKQLFQKIFTLQKINYFDSKVIS